MDFKNIRVLDIGCDPGILAILTKQLGGADILAIDIDEWSSENSIENCKASNSGGIEVKKRGIELLENEKPSDFILATVNRDILEKKLPIYSQKLIKAGVLFLIWFFTLDIDELKTVVENLKLKFISSKNENDNEFGHGF